LTELIARFADNVFWLGRYLERAENIARIIDINESFARDRTQGPNWKSVLDVYADTARFLETNDEISADAVLNFYMLDRTNPGSALSSIFMARENARTIRHLISTEMWVHLNIFRNRLAGLTRRDIWLTQIARTCADIKTSCQAFEGIAEGTFFRNEAWCFYHIGKYLERADQTTRVLQMGFDQLQADSNDSVNLVHRGVLLRSVAGYHAFRNRYPSASTADNVVSFLLYDEQFPRAVALCIDNVSLRLKRLDEIHDTRKSRTVAPQRQNLEELLKSPIGPGITSQRLHRYLDDLQIALGQLSTAISESYFE
jgi:uncharacterized alpha-E superfamily protein